MSGEGDHTRADLDAIREMGVGLSNVKKAFEGLDKLSGKYGEGFGHGGLADKFEDFASNWDISRKKLTGEVETLAKIAKEAAKVYDDIDHQLAEAIRGTQDPKSTRRGK
ncbi:hypothetical protein [Streptomyces sp. NPDC005209]|uniref:hypothetical protein n=1 Tax=Streptomyces sp. NPDC005209 TaxID=3156715 RepID=UPI0033B272D8